MQPQPQRGLTPPLRFPEFRDAPEWSYSFGNDVFEPINNKQHDSSLPILAITQEYGAIPRDAIDYRVSVTEQSIESYKVVEIGDFIISLRSFQGGIEYSQYKGMCSPAYTVLRKKTEDSEAYFKHFFKTDRFIQQLNKNIEGLRDGKMVSYKQFSELLLPIPSLPEQQKIADCLTSLDDLIAAQSQKLAALRAYKQGLLQHLFPPEGETLPPLRFPEFRHAPEWEEREVGEVFRVTRGEVLSMTLVQDAMTNEKPYPVYSSQTKNNGLAGFYSEYLYEDAITWTTDGANAGDVNYRSGRFFCTNVCGVLINTEGYANPCIAALINSVSKNHVSYVGNPKLMNGVMSKIEIPFPSVAEQQKIADCLTSLDDLIAAQSQKLAALTAHKKGLLQQLFPSPEEAQG